MRHWLDLGRYHWIVLVLIMAASSVSIAWNSYDLIRVSMANIRFLETQGLMAVMEGGLVQLVLISGQGLIVLFSYILFKGIEIELMFRWRRHARRQD